MVEVKLESLGHEMAEGTIQNWFFEEGDAVNEGDDLVELTTEGGVVTIQVPVAGILAEVYYDEGEVVAKGEVLCTIDEEEDFAEEDEEEEEETEKDKDDEDSDKDSAKE